MAYLQNFYSVPWQRIGELLPIRIPEKELIVYGPDVKEIARHELYPSGISGDFSWSAVERILAAQARPRSGWESLQAEAQDQLDQILRQSPVAPRSPAEYQALLEEMVTDDASNEDDDPAA